MLLHLVGRQVGKKKSRKLAGKKKEGQDVGREVKRRAGSLWKGREKSRKLVERKKKGQEVGEEEREGKYNVGEEEKNTK